ncbi:MAG TPA: hypothetical protein VNV17_12015 [Solirubrobacteraceae bacterium]|jgi:hypothetical protein|nr:hypothetical protein [Solirubrobacteraceae bacterium]
MTTDFEARLGQELRRVGIHGRLRGRILAEYADHLACDPEAQLGEPGALARQFADEVGSTRARRAAVTAFAALALAGVLFAAAFVTSDAAFGAAPKGGPVIGRIATGLAIVFSQVAFVAGMLAVLRWVQRRGSGVLPAAEATVIVRRAAVGVLSGIITMVSLGTIAIAYQSFLSGAWVTFTIAAAAVGTAGLLAALPSIWEAARLRPVAGGDAGDIFSDLGDYATLVPPPLRGRPWRCAAVLSVAVAVVITLVAVPAQDAFDGAARGLADALLCLAGFATLGRYLGLWSPRRAHGEPQAVRTDL